MKFTSKSSISITSMRDLLSHASLVWIGLAFAGYFIITTRQGSAIPTYFLALTGLVGILVNPLEKFDRLRSSRSFGIFFVLVIYILLSLIWHSIGLNSSNETRAALIDLIVLFFAAIAFSHVREDINLTRIVMICLLVGSSVSATSLILIEVFNFNLNHTGAWNVWSVAAIAYGFSLIISSYFSILHRANFQGAIFAFIAMLHLAALLLVGSHVVFFGLLVALVSLSFAALWESRFRRQSVFWILLCCTLLASVLYVLDILMEQKRSEIWTSTLEAIFDGNLMLGAGYSDANSPRLTCSATESVGKYAHVCAFEHPHNLFVSTIFQLGLVGFLAVFYLYLVAFGSLFEHRSAHRWLLGGCLCFSAAIFMFDGQPLVADMNYVWLIFWLPLFLIMREEFLKKEVL
jgi:O-antigen ligase